MGQRQIISKLKDELDSLESGELELAEKDVIYFLVEARKMIEHTDNAPAFPAIKFYADWAVHTRKDYAPAFIQEMMGNSEEKLKEFVDMQYLRKEMSEFLKTSGLSLSLTEDPAWHIFWRNLINVLSEQPLSLKVAVSKFTFRTNEGAESITYDYEM